MNEAVPFIGISRHRIGVDGVGVTTLAAFHGCTLKCKYCLNAICLGSSEGFERLTPQELFDRVRIDNLYFLATGGGICFGGGEPLIRVDFISEFRKLCGNGWRLTAESALNIPRENLKKAAEVIDDFIIDIKDCNPAIYKDYTGHSNRRALYNLRCLVKKKGADHIMVRVPLIPNHNSESDRDASIEWLKSIGITKIDKFNYIIRDKK